MKHYYLLDIDQLPQRWDDLNGRQLSAACRILNEKLPAYLLVEQLLAALFDVQKGFIHTSMDDALKAIDFLFNPTDRTKAPFEVYRVGWRKLYPPAEKLKNSTFGEFITADSAFINYIKTGEEAHLNKLCACLYRTSKHAWERRSRNYNGDRRIPFNSNAIEMRSKSWERVPLADKLAILTYFSGSRTAIAKSHPRLFKEDEGGKSASWLSALHVFTENITQYDPVLNTRTNIVLFEMSKQIEDAERIDELINSKKRPL